MPKHDVSLVTIDVPEQLPWIPALEDMQVADFDRTDIVILKKFLDNFSYPLKILHLELSSDPKVKHLQLESLRYRLEDKLVKRKLLVRDEGFCILYELNEPAIPQIKKLIREFFIIDSVEFFQ